jgi:AcrR family transcriptional regulator
MGTETDPSPRPPLTKDRILQAAVDLADREGLGALTMRHLGAELGVEAMSLYKHVANKDAILDGVVELIASKIAVPAPGTPWRDALRERATSAREVLGAHSWSIGLLEARGSMGPATMGYLDAMLGILIRADFTIEDAAHAMWLLDAYVYGHVIQETSIARGAPELPDTDPAMMADYPHLSALMVSARGSGYSVDREFTYGLDRIVEALTPD